MDCGNKMDKKGNKSRRKSNNPDRKIQVEFGVTGITSPPKGATMPFSVSPVGDSLHAFASADHEENLESPAVKLSEFITKKKKRRRRKNGVARKPNNSIQKDLDSIEDRAESLNLEDKDANPDNVHEGKVLEESSSHGSPDSQNLEKEPQDLESILIKKLMDQLKSADLPNASEDEVSQNLQEQDDEILALECIYEGGFKVLSTSNTDLCCFMIEVPMEIGEKVEAIVELGTHESASTSHNSASYSFKLEYLPPFHLACILPREYPSLISPVFVLESECLSSDKLIHLTQQLKQIWEEHKGGVVVYQWTEFLHSQALSFIGASEKLSLTKSLIHPEDPSVFSRCESPENDVVTLLRYDEEMQLQAFLSSFHMCNICFTEYTGKEFVKLPCQHIYCRSCMQSHSQVHVNEGSLIHLKCPTVGCAGSIPPHILKDLLGDEEYERWERLSLQKTLDSMSDVVYCPRCDTPCIEDEKEHDAQCEKCFFSYCTLCRMPRHVGQECLSPEARLVILQERGKGVITEEQRRKQQNLINELKNLDEINKNSKQCPRCGMAISKTEGCNKMICSNCGQFFCFRCGQGIPGYQHFREGDCRLFEVEEIQRWEENAHIELWRLVHAQEVWDQRAREQERLRVHPELVKNCPQCRQPNAKEGNNNHMMCMACQTRYCFLCLKVVRRPAEHYGPNKCKQHTL